MTTLAPDSNPSSPAGAAAETLTAPTAPPVVVRDFSMLIALLAIGGYFAIAAPSFLEARNLSYLAIEVSITAVLALGMLLVLLPGHIDLSAGSSAALFGAVAAVLIFNHGWPAALAMLTALVAGVVVYWLMGLLIIKEKVPAFIITLGGLLIFRGLQWLVIQNATIPVTTGGQANLYSLLTTYNVPPAFGWIIAGGVIALMGLAAWAGYRRLRALPGVTVSGEMVFMRWMVSAQLIALFVLICNQFRGLPLPAIILGAAALAVHLLTHAT